MDVVVENLSELKRKMNVTVSAEEIDQKTNDKLNELKGRVKMPGFRPGKVPFEVVKRRYGKSARQDVITEAISSTYFEALQKEDLHPVGQPHIDPPKTDFGQPLTYVATFEIYPKFELVDLEGVSLEKTISEVTEQDIDDSVEKMRKQHAEWIETDEPSRKGDQLVIDFDGTIKSEPFKGGSAKEFKFELGAGSMLEDFEKNLDGVKAGSDVKFKLKFPKDYGDETVSGKKAEFTIKVHKVLNPKLPELTDEFLANMGIKEGGVESLRQKLREHMDRELQDRLKARFRKQVLDQLVEKNPITLPEILVDSEIAHLQEQTKQQYAQVSKKKIEDLPDYPRDQFEKDAIRRVQLGLLLSELVKAREIKVDPEKVREKIKDMGAAYGDIEGFVDWYYTDKKRVETVESVVLEAEVIELLEKQVEIAEKKLSYDEAMKQQAE